MTSVMQRLHAADQQEVRDFEALIQSLLAHRRAALGEFDMVTEPEMRYIAEWVHRTRISIALIEGVHEGLFALADLDAHDLTFALPPSRSGSSAA